MSPFTTFRSALLAAAFAGFAGAAEANGYAFTTIDAGVPFELGTVVTGLNDAGRISGYYVQLTAGGPAYSAFTGNVDGSGFTTINRPGYLGTGASGINNLGQIVGVSVDPTFAASGFLRTTGGAFATIDPGQGGLTSAYSEAVGINDQDEIVGYFTKVTPPSQGAVHALSHGFVLSGGTYSELDVPAAWGFGTQLYGVNDSGQISGAYLDFAGIPHGFLYTPGQGFTQPAVPGSFASELGAINNKGDYVAAALGYDPFSPIGEDAHGFIHTAAGFTPFNVPGALDTEPFTINDNGQVVGLYVNGRGQIEGFTATPLPEPEAWSLMISGMVYVGLIARRKRGLGSALFGAA
jgi:uncharacterized membrane protein